MFTVTIKYRFVPLMPKNTYGNSINAQHVAPRIEERNILVEYWLYFYLVEFSTTRREDIKYETAAKLARMYHSRFISTLPRTALASGCRMQTPTIS
jgi:hypothetical protein